MRASFDVRSVAEVQRADRLEADLLQMLCAAGRADLRPLLFARWGHTVLKLLVDLPPDVRPVLQDYNDLRQPGAVIELPIGSDGYGVAPQPPPCA